MNKNERYIKDLFKLVGTNSILLIDKQGKLARLYCPFEVIVTGIEHIEEFKILLLNRANMVLGIASISRGGIAGTVIDTRIILF